MLIPQCKEGNADFQSKECNADFQRFDPFKPLTEGRVLCVFVSRILLKLRTVMNTVIKRPHALKQKSMRILPITS